MGLLLIPVGHGGNPILQGQIATIGMPAQILNRHFEVPFEANGVRDMPAIETEALHDIVMAVAFDDLGQAGIGSGEFGISTSVRSSRGTGLRSFWCRKIVRATRNSLRSPSRKSLGTLYPHP